MCPFSLFLFLFCFCLVLFYRCCFFVGQCEILSVRHPDVPGPYHNHTTPPPRLEDSVSRSLDLHRSPRL